MGLMNAYPPRGIDPLFLANQAAAFFGISRCILSRLTSRFRGGALHD